MSNLRSKVLGLAAVASVFAGLSYGQISCAPVGTGVAPAGAFPAGASAGFQQVNVPSLRSEGETELVMDYLALCNNTGAATSGTLFITTSAPITSKVIPGFGTTPASNEATLQVSTGGYLPNEAALTGIGGANTAGLLFTSAVVGSLPDTIAGTINATQASFTIPAGGIPAGLFYIQVSNIRVNASASTTAAVTESGLLSYAQGAVSNNAQITNATNNSVATDNVGVSLQSLGVAFGTATGQTTVAISACSASNQAIGTLAPASSFTLLITELEPGAFKLSGSAATGGEGGSYAPGAGSAVGTAATATEIQLVLGNVPSNVTIYVPSTVTPPGGGGTTLSTVGGTPISTGAYANMTSFVPANGAVTILYSVTGIGTAGSPVFTVPVIVAYTPAAFTAAVPSVFLTVAPGYAPQAAVTGPASAIPTFAVSTATPLNASKITGCNTTLLFPYVTNVSGYETGIAVINTTTDNLGTIPGIPSAASPTTGTCTLYFYGNAASPTPTVTPSLGAYSSTAPTVVPVFANTLTAMVGSSGFSGYAIASCNFLEAHGFSYIVDNSGTTSGTAEGFPAIVIPSSRNENNGSAVNLSFTIKPAGAPAPGNTIGAAASISVSATGSVAGITGQ